MVAPLRQGTPRLAKCRVAGHVEKWTVLRCYDICFHTDVKQQRVMMTLKW
jgi:hypothetical protein